MAPASHVDIDPDGDVLAILLRPVEPFAPWPSDAEDESSAPVANDEASNNGESQESTAHDKRTLRLSSKHLMLACPRLKAMFTGQWEEVTKIHSDGLQHWDLGDNLDPDAFVIVMNIIHGRNRSVPQKVDLEMLAKICVIIDDLECHEATELFSRVWLMAFGGKTPSTYCRDLILRIFVASVLREPDIFLITTRTAMLSSAQEIRSLGLPIRLDIVERMEGGRKRMLRDTIRSLHGVADTLCGVKPRCSYECDAILYGMLIKQMRDIGLPRPGEAIPDQGFAMESLVRSICQFKDPTWFSQMDVAHQFQAEPEPPKSSPFGSFGSFGSAPLVSQPASPSPSIFVPPASSPLASKPPLKAPTE
ncbi:hypothetical protein SAPIO_CDS4942 [Scedosporium apiospermum]|uniref:BTB domain-containing protein n=1 Tax=Pseudallescheria apiosperma TaxID=563466 RepID=A0A084G7D6_PSEDA|nr:uncharacterized protein SAPIO_CDS4942 [Scedosporium apiospermum]KEZ43248.1 hypothetical protein SAPIO_CDS4942 [Scedosporium apiospermum]